MAYPARMVSVDSYGNVITNAEAVVRNLIVKCCTNSAFSGFSFCSGSARRKCGWDIWSQAEQYVVAIIFVQSSGALLSRARVFRCRLLSSPRNVNEDFIQSEALWHKRKIQSLFKATIEPAAGELYRSNANFDCDVIWQLNRKYFP